MKNEDLIFGEDVGDGRLTFPTANEFTSVLGQVTWLMTVSTDYRDKTASWIESYVAAPLLLKQVRVVLKEKQPVAAIIWGYLSAEVQSKLSNDAFVMSLPDWRSGPTIAVVECISPFANKEIIVSAFLRDARVKQS